MSAIFISYAAKDRAFVAQLAAALSQDGWDVWWDRELFGGEDFEAQIEKQLGAAACVIVVWSAQSLKSNWVKGEARVGLERGVLVPVLKERVIQPIDCRGIHADDLVEWDGKRESEAYGHLRRSVARLVGEARAHGQPAALAQLPRRPLSVAFAASPVLRFSVRVGLWAAAGLVYGNLEWQLKAATDPMPILPAFSGLLFAVVGALAASWVVDYFVVGTALIVALATWAFGSDHGLVMAAAESGPLGAVAGALLGRAWLAVRGNLRLS